MLFVDGRFIPVWANLNQFDTLIANLESDIHL